VVVVEDVVVVVVVVGMQASQQLVAACTVPPRASQRAALVLDRAARDAVPRAAARHGARLPAGRLRRAAPDHPAHCGRS
jgi:hypothetical protein